MNGLPALTISMTAPLLIAVFLLKDNARRFAAFLVAGLTVCLLSAYINSFFVASVGMVDVEVIIKLTPISEEVMKALPVFFFLAVFQPKREHILQCAIAVGLGFAMAENAYVLISAGGAGNPLSAVVRGFSAGLMHTVCGALLGHGLALTYRQKYMAVPAAFGLLCLTSTCHAIYNLFVSAGGRWETVGYVLPFAVVTTVLITARKPF